MSAGDTIERSSCLYEGSVRHRRLGGELRDEFHYRLFMAYIDLDELPSLFDQRWLWSARRPAPAWFRRADHLGDPDVPLADSVRSVVAARTGSRPQGPIRVLTHLRYLGHCFNPVSFYYCFAPGGERVQAVLADVTNTPWGESHSYVLDARTGHAGEDESRLLRGSFAKQLHVSPLMGMSHVYDWRLTVPNERLSVHISSSRRAAGAAGDGSGPADSGPADGGRANGAPANGPPMSRDPSDGEPVFDATLSLARREMTSAEMARALVRYPFMTGRIVARIYTHALRLRLRGATYHPHPDRAPVSA